MSISGSLSNALSGMTAAARSAEVVSSNVANATTDGYGRRVLETSSRTVGGTGSGVQVDGIRRDIDQRALAERRLSDAQLGQAGAGADFYGRLETAIGLPEDAASLSAGFADFEAALIQAASQPESETRLSAVLQAAQTVQHRLSGASDQIQALRMEADGNIATEVALLNDRLEKIADLNGQIRRQNTAGTSSAALMDQRQALVDEISAIVPLRQVTRDGGQIALYTMTGGTLLDGNPATFSFDPAGTIVPEMSMASGALSGLRLNGQPIETMGPYSPIAGGSLAGHFTVRDELAPAAQTELDALARNLIERFQSSGVDPTLGATDAGLFTDAGAAFSGANELGLSARLQINAAVDPAQGGATWRLRDGINAVTPGQVGNATLLGNSLTALTAPATTATGSFAGTDNTAGALADGFLSLISQQRQSAEATLSFAQAKNTALVTSELEGGVDTDQEMQTLLLIEQAYAANARVVQTVSDMLDTLMGI